MKQYGVDAACVFSFRRVWRVAVQNLEASMPVTAESAAPYAPISVMMDIIERHRDRGLPRPVNGETLQRAGLVTESLTPRTLYALYTLDLIDAAGNPTPVFEGIRLAPEAEYKKRMEDWLKAAYADVFSFTDPSKDDVTAIGDAFRSYTPPGQRDRMVNLFIGLCRAAGIMPDKSASTPLRTRPSSNGPRTTAARPTVRQPSKASSKSPTQDSVTSGLPPALVGLLQSLPDPSIGWLEAERDKFNTTFKTLLDFYIPVVKEKPKAKIDETEE